MKLTPQELVAKARAANALREATLAANVKHSTIGATDATKVFTATGSFHATILGFTYNERQTQAIELSMRAKSFCLIGAAGTGKTTTTREIIGQLTRLPHITAIGESTKYLTKGEPGIAVVSFTNKAINNIKRFLPDELKKHCLTLHKILEFVPIDPLLRGSGLGMFVPTYHAGNKLPHIACVIIEEASMVGTELWQQFMSALPAPEKTQFIFLGDLNQLPPIFGYSILGFKLLELETVELTEVYRQAMLSPIITLAHQIRLGKGLDFKLVEGPPLVRDCGEDGKVTIHPWRKRIAAVAALKTTIGLVHKLIDAGDYNPDKDVILCPFNKSFGTLELNRGIAQKLGEQRDEIVHEVIAGFAKHYLAVGDRVLVDRMEAKILQINHTTGYGGKIPQSASKKLDRWGVLRDELTGRVITDGPIDLQKGHDILDELVSDEDKKNLSSHTIKVEMIDTGLTKTLSAVGDINAMLFSYALTVHKSQGSEWHRVFIFLHWTHNSMISRELMYTAITRAKHELYIVCEPQRDVPGAGITRDSLTKAAQSPEIKGTTLAEKAEFFKGKSLSRRDLLTEN